MDYRSSHLAVKARMEKRHKSSIMRFYKRIPRIAWAEPVLGKMELKRTQCQNQKKLMEVYGTHTEERSLGEFDSHRTY